MSHERALLPHPVLRPGGIDYREDCTFQMEIGAARRTQDGDVLVEGSFDLSSATLTGMIRDDDAEFFVVAKCAKTYLRHALGTDGAIALKILAGDLADTLKLTPYVVASKEIPWFASEEHDDEIRAMPGGASIPPGSILAVGASHEIEIDEIGTIQAAIKLVSNDQVEEGLYTINIDGDYVLIELGPKTYRDVALMRRHAPDLLYPSIYQTTVEYAMQEMDDHAASKWARALQKTLADCDIKIDDNLQKTAHKHAQIVLDKPLHKLIEWNGSHGAE